jgi:hypothetical protein
MFLFRVPNRDPTGEEAVEATEDILEEEGRQSRWLQEKLQS